MKIILSTLSIFILGVVSLFDPTLALTNIILLLIAVCIIETQSWYIAISGMVAVVFHKYAVVLTSGIDFNLIVTSISDFVLLTIVLLFTYSYINGINATNRFKNLSIKDPLTNVYNRRYVETVIVNDYEKMSPFSIVIIDIDNFKKINDTYGHLFGDIILKRISHRITSSIHETDITVRMGGDEFIVLLPFTNMKVANNIAERLRLMISEMEIVDPQGDSLRVTISLGVTQINKTESFEDALSRADAALYTSKVSGRDNITMA